MISPQFKCRRNSLQMQPAKYCFLFNFENRWMLHNCCDFIQTKAHETCTASPIYCLAVTFICTDCGRQFTFHQARTNKLVSSIAAPRRAMLYVLYVTLTYIQNVATRSRIFTENTTNTENSRSIYCTGSIQENVIMLLKLLFSVREQIHFLLFESIYYHQS